MNDLIYTSDVSIILTRELRERVQGEVFLPGDAGYDQARSAWNLSVSQHPAVIVSAEVPGDVVAAVEYARAADLSIAFQSTGHGVAVPADNAMLIRSSKMTAVEIDAEAQTAYVEAGAKWGMVLEKAQQVGLTPLLGSSPTVGVVGYTLGGGMGWLARRYGLALDSVLYFDVVTADGRRLRVSETENANLFWGMRGGGGTLAIVTGMAIKLYPVTTVYAGNLLYPIERAREVFSRFREWIKTAPDELTSSVSIMHYPPLPQVPEIVRGKSFVIIRGCYTGDLDAGKALIDGWRAWAQPAVDMFGPLPFAQAAVISSDPVDPLPGLSSGAWLAELSDEAIDTILQYALPAGGPPTLVKVEIRHAGGAISRVPADANAYSHRDAELILQMVAVTPTAEAHHAAEAHIRAFKSALKPHMTGGVFINFLDGEEAREQTRAAFLADHYRRLTALKTTYDPDNRFRHSFAIEPDKARG